MISNTAIKSLICYCMIFFYIYITKPPFLFKKNGCMRGFGCNGQKKILSIHNLIIIISISSYIIISLFDRNNHPQLLQQTYPNLYGQNVLQHTPIHSPYSHTPTIIYSQPHLSSYHSQPPPKY